jgi:hypothetical protein
MWWAAASLGLSAIEAGASFLGRQEQARQMRRETDEEVRRFQRQADFRLGAARAAGAASGIEFESRSLQDYLGDMTSEFQRQAQWMRDAGYRKAAGVDQASTFGLVSDLGGSMFSFGAANNWWRGGGA